MATPFGIEFPRGSWIGRFVRWLAWGTTTGPRGERGWQWRYALVALVSALVVYLLGFILAAMGGFTSLYVRGTPSIYAGIFALAWVTFWGAWGDERLQLNILAIQDAFLDPAEFTQRYVIALRRVFNWREHCLWAVGLMLVAWSVVGLRTSGVWGSLALFPQGWSSPPGLLAKNLVLDLYAVPILFLLVTMMLGAVRYLQLVGSLAGLRLVLPLEVARVRLRPLAYWGVYAGFGWSIGTATLIILFRTPLFEQDGQLGGRDLIAPVVVFAAMAIWAMLLLAWPQYKLHRALACEKRYFIEASFASLVDSLGRVKLTPREYVKALEDPRNERLEALTRQATAAPAWVFPAPVEVLMIVSQGLIPIITFAISS